MAIADQLKNPWVIGGAGLILVVIIYLGRNASGAASAGVASQSVATSANVQLAGLTSQVNLNADNANAAIVMNGQRLQGQVFSGLLSYLGTSSNNNTVLASQQSQVSGAIAINRDNNATTLTLAPELAAMADKSKVDLANIGSSTALGLGKMQADVQTLGIQTSGAVAVHGQDVQQNIDPIIAKTNADAAVSIANIRSTTALSLADYQLQARNNQLIASGLTSFINPLSGLLGGGGGGGGIYGGGGTQQSGGGGGGGLFGFLGNLFGGGGGGGAAAAGSGVVDSGVFAF